MYLYERRRLRKISAKTFYKIYFRGFVLRHLYHHQRSKCEALQGRVYKNRSQELFQSCHSPLVAFLDSIQCGLQAEFVAKGKKGVWLRVTQASMSAKMKL